MKYETYVRKAKVIRVVDGDTLDVELDLGCRVKKQERIRLARINAPERFTEEGKAATGFLRSHFGIVQEITIQTGKNPEDKYGRYIAEIWDDLGRNLSDLLLTENLAVPYEGLKVRVLG